MKRIMGLLLFASLVILSGCSENDESIVNVYTTRHYDSDDALYEQFTGETGITVNVVTDKGAVSIEKIKAQGENVVADIFMTSDAGNLSLAKEAGILQSIESDILESNIPSKYQDEDNMWFGLTKRARVILYSEERVLEEELAGLNYQTLVTNNRWEERVLVRSSSNMYNQSLIASFVALYGNDVTNLWVQNLKTQMARNPEGNDRDQALAIHEGLGDLAIANSYYYGQLITDIDPTSKYYGVAKDVGIYFPGQLESEDGVHVNISGAGVINHAPNKENAVKLLEFLSNEKQQEAFSATNYEFPVNPNANMSELLQSWLTKQGIETLKEQSINLNELGTYQQDALNIMVSQGWDTPLS